MAIASAPRDAGGAVTLAPAQSSPVHTGPRPLHRNEVLLRQQHAGDAEAELVADLHGLALGDRLAADDHLQQFVAALFELDDRPWHQSYDFLDRFLLAREWTLTGTRIFSRLRE